MNHPELDIQAIIRQLLLRRIEAALARIGREGFGECGEWISAKRLQWDPTVLKCIDCAE